MNRPFVLIRFLGAPLVALPVFLLCCALMVGFYEGHTSWQIALVAAGLSFRTMTAASRMRRYKAWRREWDSMEPESERPQKAKHGSSVITAMALLVVVGVPVFIGSLPSDVAFSGEQSAVVVWCVASFYVLAKLVRFIVRRRSARRRAAPGVETVTWLIGKPASSPDRQAAMEALPDYCIRLLAGVAPRGR